MRRGVSLVCHSYGLAGSRILGRVPKIRAENLDLHNQMVWASLLGAWNTLLSEKSYEAITLADIAGAAGLARNSVYRYARDKNELFAAIVDMAAEALLDDVTVIAAEDAPPMQRVARMIARILATVDQTTLAALRRPMPDNAASTSVPALFAEFRHVLEDGMIQGEVRPLDDLQLTVDLMSGLVGAAVAQVGMGADATQVTAAVVDIATRALAVQPGVTPAG